MKLYVADYLGDTGALTAIEHGAYLLLLMGMWRAGGKLPANDEKLARLARCSPEEWEAIKATILGLFRRRGARLSHKRVTAERNRYVQVSSVRKKTQSRIQSEKRSKHNGQATTNVPQKKHKCSHNQNHNQKSKNSAPSEQRVLTPGVIAAACVEDAAPFTPLTELQEMEQRALIRDGLKELAAGLVGSRRIN
jgi:uncharacterized protein YdaU (DUF1376 family)